VRFDVSATHKGYCGSVARTAVFGEPTPQVERAYLALQSGLEAASDAARPGASAGHIVETAARAVRTEAHPGDTWRLLGHGIGLASLERPDLAPGGVAIIEAGEVLCVEAPYYDIGSMGLAVRDTLLITSAGARAMNRSRHDLVVLD
jgi:Xaa-Pro aminopeptidase